MTTTTPARRSTTQPASPIRLSAAGILRSEWIKLRTLRSTVWAYAVILVIQIAFGLLIVAISVNDGGISRGPERGITLASLATFGPIAGVAFGQLVVSVLGVLVISGEYTTGQIRSSFAAVPKRLPVLWAKVAVFGVVTFVVSLVSILLTYLVTAPILSGAGVTSNLFEGNLLLTFVGAAGYLALIGILSMAIGAILRSTAGGIAGALGLLLVVPVVFSLIPADWAHSLSDWLPSAAGSNIYQPGIFEWWQGLLILLGWIVVALATAATLMRRRDA
ncbi:MULTISPECIES: ABC transporter permease [Subtercola]|uniref:ABC transporter permease n=1 Tax=Subtercola vilae TaxID=2056433 RepID=A0A4V4RG41_9MICO|nr:MULTISPECIES: ABC transporter permease [Subtercola]MEA9986402.1 ABC transporter permease [Subtercola sp. RTI3]TIH40334.1 ABC transporter permease [Subtercola vilae]